MSSRWVVWVWFGVGVALCAAAPRTMAHGGVVLEDDLCVIQVGFYRAHFTVFQPGTRGHQQFCEDLPDRGETVFVLEYLHDGLERLPVDFRIVRNTTGLGRFAVLGDLKGVVDLDEITEFYQPALRNPDVFAVLHHFGQQGEFIGVVTATHPDTGAVYTAVFPFEVGAINVDWSVFAWAGLLMAPFVVWSLMTLRRRRNAGAVVALALLGLCPPPEAVAAVGDDGTASSVVSEQGHFKVVFSQELSPVPINVMHTWRLHVTSAAEDPVDGLDIQVTGGMPAHDHGLPTDPRVTGNPGNGVYMVEGVKFHMHGVWQIELTLSDGRLTDRAILEIRL